MSQVDDEREDEEDVDIHEVGKLVWKTDIVTSDGLIFPIWVYKYRGRFYACDEQGPDDPTDTLTEALAGRLLKPRDRGEVRDYEERWRPKS